MQVLTTTLGPPFPHRYQLLEFWHAPEHQPPPPPKLIPPPPPPPPLLPHVVLPPPDLCGVCRM